MVEIATKWTVKIEARCVIFVYLIVEIATKWTVKKKARKILNNIGNSRNSDKVDCKVSTPPNTVH